MKPFDILWLEIRTHLEQQKKQINDEIFHYPPPIPACDAQFNYLLEERVRLTQELQRIDEVSVDGLAELDRSKLISDFIQSCAYIDETLATQLMAYLETEPRVRHYP